MRTGDTQYPSESLKLGVDGEIALLPLLGSQVHAFYLTGTQHHPEE